jgi:hypothetical protein
VGLGSSSGANRDPGDHFDSASILVTGLGSHVVEGTGQLQDARVGMLMMVENRKLRDRNKLSVRSVAFCAFLCLSVRAHTQNRHSSRKSGHPRILDQTQSMLATFLRRAES